jgi:hypothetical protein
MKTSYQISIQVLQNGVCVASHEQPFSKRKKIKLSSSPRRNFAVPFYPLYGSLLVAKARKKHVSFFVNPGWEGFVVSGSTLSDVGKKKGKSSFKLKANDYAKISKNDLTVLFKIAKLTGPKKTSLDPSYRGSLSDLLFEGSSKLAVLLAFAFASLISLGFVLGLQYRGYTQVTRIDQLTADYNLPLIHPKHLETLPEALQSHLDRTAPIGLAIRFYDSVIAMLAGEEVKEKDLIFGNSQAKWQQIHKTKRKAIKDQVDREEKYVNQVAAKANQGILLVPTIQGAPLAQSLLDIKSRLEFYHQGLEKVLEQRRDTTKNFDKDSQYDFEDYRTNSKKTNEALARIDVFSMLTDEEAMYQEMITLARKAEAKRSFIRGNRQKVADISWEQASGIGIPTTSRVIGKAEPEYSSDYNKKLMSVMASFYDASSRKLREPLLGEVDKKLIEAVVEKNHLQLQVCFEHALKRDRSLHGKMEWKWILTTQGEIVDLNLVSSTIRSSQMTKCVKQKILGWRFPKPKKGSIEITYPFFFTPKKT